ncbi:MAG TPA: ATP-binding protein [Methanocorpusculum sp.]|nr:ATP-binding protein [Methanocorpusculum sp.]
MLLDFRFTNYKSFKNTAELDLTATKVTEYPHHVVETAGEKVLKTAAIYGANASGKTNIYDALNYMKYYVIHSFAFGGDTPEGNRSPQLTLSPFLFDSESRDAETTFEIWFTIPGDDKEYTYNYGFSLQKETVTEEWLNYKTRTGREFKSIFHREADKLPEYYAFPEKLRENLNISLNNATLLVSLGAKLKIEKLEKIYAWFTRLILLNFGNPLDNMLISRRMPPGFEKNEDVRKNVAEYINTFDGAIAGFTVETVKNPDASEGFIIYAQHRDAGTGELISMPFQEESAGTQKMFAIYSPLQTVLDSGGVLFIDELNDRLHPLLVRNLIQTFIDPDRNKNNAQLIFTAHDVWQLDAGLLRRDEIWFTEKGADGETSLYSLVDFKGENGDKIRNDENILKNYLKGKYGAIPHLGEIQAEKTLFRH